MSSMSPHRLEYTHKTHPRSRSIKIKVLPDTRLEVVAPPGTSQHHIDQFVTSQLEWIERTRRRLNRLPLVWDERRVMVFGEYYQRQLLDDDTAPPGVRLAGQALLINADGKQTQTQLRRFLRHTAQAYIIPRSHRLAEQMGAQFNSLGFREQKTRWGSCSRRGHLSFNWRLVHAPPQVIDYVIVHELAHLRHMNHSRRFWQLVERHQPEFWQHRRWLREHRLL